MDANIALLGLSGSGKTNFINEAIRDINSFFPKILIESHTSMEGTETKDFSDLSFTLKAYDGVQWDFNVCDYNGELIKAQESDNVYFPEIKKHFQSSNAWIILLDANYFAFGTKEEIVRLFKRKVARYLSPYISDYAEEHDEKPPELLFVITKADGLLNIFPQIVIKDIVMEAFESVFTPEYSPMILLSDTTITKSAGLAILTLFYIRYADELSNRVLKLNNRNHQIEDDVKELGRLIREIEAKKILGKLPANRDKVKSYQGQIESLDMEKGMNDIEINQCSQDMGIKHLGTAVQCFIDNNSRLAINGFDRIHYSYDKTLEEIKGSDTCMTVAALLHFLIIIGFAIYSIATTGILNVLKVLVPVIVLLVFVGLAADARENTLKIIFGIFAIGTLIYFGSIVGAKGLMILVGYIAFLVITVVIAEKLDKTTGKRCNKSVQRRYKDEVTLFFDSKVRGKK